MMSVASRNAIVQPHIDRDQARLIEAWRHEFLHVAMMTAFVTMGCTAATEQDVAAALANAETHVPAGPAIHRAVRQGLLHISTRFDPAYFAAQDGYDRLDIAISALRAARTEAESGRIVDAARLSLLWRETSQSLANVLDVFDRNGLLPGFELPDTSLDVQCPRKVLKLLRVAARGETMSSLRTGAPDGTLPGRVQRRRWNRRNVNLPCSVETRGRFVEASIRNIAQSGALLDGVVELPRGTQLVVTTGDGRKLPASVIWCHARAVGIRFRRRALL